MLRSDLIVAIEQCLQQKTANRWPDAKSLRSELVPMDDDTDVLAVRLLRFSSVAALLLTPSFSPPFVSATIFGQFNSGRIRTLAVILAFGVIALFVSGFGAAVNQAKVCTTYCVQVAGYIPVLVFGLSLYYEQELPIPLVLRGRGPYA